MFEAHKYSLCGYQISIPQGESWQGTLLGETEGFQIPRRMNKVCQLPKEIYSMKQAGRHWHEHLQWNLTDVYYMKPTSGDVSIFKYHELGDQIMIILVYVDDMAIFCSQAKIESTKKIIGSWYKHTDLGETKHFFGLYITQTCFRRRLSILLSTSSTVLVDRFLANPHHQQFRIGAGSSGTRLLVGVLAPVPPCPTQ